MGKTRTATVRLGGTAGAGDSSAPSIPLPSGLPPGVDPSTYRHDYVTQLLKRAAYLSLFSIHNPDAQNVPIPVPGRPRALAGISVFEELHRFEVKVESRAFGFVTRKTVGQRVARVHIEWYVIPDGFPAHPDRKPPPTALDPRRQQRFTMMEGSFLFDDESQSGFRGFGAGRTFPVVEDGQARLQIGAVVDVLEGLGELEGMKGTAVVNGYISPPGALALNIMVRLLDPDLELRSRRAPRPLEPVADPDPSAAFLMLLGEEDRDHPTTLNVAADGTLLGSNVNERLRLVSLSLDLGPDRGAPRSMTHEGAVVGRLTTKLYFDPLNRAASGGQDEPVPWQTRGGKLTFLDSRGNVFGSLQADVIEGRGFEAVLPGAPFPVFRLGGFGPFQNGSGQFAGISGMLSVNGVVSIFPRTLSNLYVLRIYDPEGRFRSACREAWT